MPDSLGVREGRPVEVHRVLPNSSHGRLEAPGLFLDCCAVLWSYRLAKLVEQGSESPRDLKRWIAPLFPVRSQPVFVTTWDLAVEKTGGYVSARVVLAFINGSTTSLFMLLIGMPYWLVLGIWTGVVAQFVPTIGTYIAIILPTVVGLLSPQPIDGVLVLVWGLVYQQVENLTIEPRISAKAVDVHPAVSFASVMLGAALFGAAGAILAIPVTATVLALFDIYGHKYELLPQLNQPDPVRVPERRRASRRVAPSQPLSEDPATG